MRRSRNIGLSLLIALIIASALIVVSFWVAADRNPPKISSLGRYSGYSQPLYSSWVRTSQYVQVRDGTKLAVDIIRPTLNDKPVEEPLPVLFTFERYGRARFTGGKNTIIRSQVELSPFASMWFRYGYVIVAADVRGSGASFGTRQMEFNDGKDAYDLIEWIAKQPWSNGKVGMYGLSYPGMTQLMAASEAPIALKAIIPRMVSFDGYSIAYPGGIFNYKFVQSWATMVQGMDKAGIAVPVDEDKEGTMAAAAQREHQNNVNISDTALVSSAYRDATRVGTQDQVFKEMSLHTLVDKINRSGVAVYQFAGWYDVFARDQAAWFNNLMVPQRILFTPYSHASGFDSGWSKTISPLVNDSFEPGKVIDFQTAEQLRFFDYYLKGIDNDIAAEPPVRYYVMGAPADQAWRSATQWPLPNQVLTNYYFNAGLLDTNQPATPSGEDSYQVDYSATNGTSTRWSNTWGGPFSYGDMRSVDAKSLTYTTLPLITSVEMTGHPVVHLWVTSSADDGDFFVYLEEVDPDGYSHYISEGMLRGSHRALSQAPYQYMALPYHRSFKEDISPLPQSQPVELVFDLLPTANIFDAGQRIRIRIVSADADNFLTPKADPAPTVHIYRSKSNASYIVLPVIPASNG